ncbi:DNA ligase-1 [Methylophilus rhizosphaerae]|uniref:DNA ligase-1 n=1 Tax=Methylophilus rhizosphaerae TaxID=492660 RepID=A0A1G9B7U8_9PROT|nr:DNA ligase [Methylophilus rhizosphaerae]SDK35553.1 DNA ligase-1 [Methylophilus rhizosphaerae]
MRGLHGFIYFLLLWFEPVAPAYAQVPDILLAHIYHEGIDVREYLVSEKLDGVRAIWDGKQLISRQGNPIHAPGWFTRGFPTQSLDGELWIGRGQFELLSGTVRQSTPSENDWRKVAYYVFELSNAEGTFSERARQIERIVGNIHSPYLKAIKQFHVSDEASLKRTLDSIVARHGEGLMLHRADAPYVTGRNHVLLKLKPQLDAEARVIAHVPGKGKYLGKVGALLVETPQGLQFRLGTGFSDAERAQPPAIGSIVTYTYRDLTKNGKPKFASFLRVRPPE